MREAKTRCLGRLFQPGKLLIAISNVLKFAFREDVLQPVKAFWCALMRQLHALFGTILTVRADNRSRRGQALALITREDIRNTATRFNISRQAKRINNRLRRAV